MVEFWLPGTGGSVAEPSEDREPLLPVHGDLHGASTVCCKLCVCVDGRVGEQAGRQAVYVLIVGN